MAYKKMVPVAIETRDLKIPRVRPDPARLAQHAVERLVAGFGLNAPVVPIEDASKTAYAAAGCGSQ